MIAQPIQDIPQGVKYENNKQSLTLWDNLSQPFLHILT